MSDSGSHPPSAVGSTSSSLIAAARARDPAAWDRLARLYGPLVYGWARKTGLQGQDAADIVQEVFRKVHGALDRFEHQKPDSRFRAWLRTITRNEILQHIRRRADRPQARGGTEAQRALQQIPEPLADEQEPSHEDQQARLAQRALELIRSEFEPRTWQAFVEFTVKDRTAADVGAELGMSPQAVHQAKYRVLKRLRDMLADE